MKNLLNVVLLTIVFSCGSAYATVKVPSNENSMVVMLFLGFLALLIVMQLIPGVMLFCSMVKGLFSRSPRNAVVADDKPGKSA